eukprot:SAG22_NODE_3348_length_1764_cov_2.810210_2_plen_390_part_00
MDFVVYPVGKSRVRPAAALARRGRGVVAVASEMPAKEPAAAAPPAVNSMSRLSTTRVAHTFPVRPARAADAPAVAAMAAAGAGGGGSTITGDPAAGQDLVGTTACYVADGGPGVGVVGSACIVLPGEPVPAGFDATDADTAIIADIRVRPDLARQQPEAADEVCRKLLAAAEGYCAQCGSAVAVLGCDPAADAAACALYERAGWSADLKSGLPSARRVLLTKSLAAPVDYAAAPSAAAGMTELTAGQVAEFLENGFILLEDCIDKQLCAEWRAAAWSRIGMAADDPGTWSQEFVGVPGAHSEPVSTLAPRAWRAICDLIGGPDRAAGIPSWGDSFALNLGKPQGQRLEAQAGSGPGPGSSSGTGPGSGFGPGSDWHPPSASFPGAGCKC